MFNRIRLFIRQPFTETRSKNELNKVFSIIDNYKKYPLDILPYKSAGESSDFKSFFTPFKVIPFSFNRYLIFFSTFIVF